MNPMRALNVLLAGVILSASGALHAQPREPVQGPPENWQNMYANGRLSDEEKRGANPCPRPDRDANPVKSLHPRRRGARISICVGKLKSQAVTDAWANGLDEYGAQLKPDAGVKKLAEMELWLRSLVGKYRIEGEYAVTDGISQVNGTADCFGIGSGPGVSCVLSAAWKAPRETAKNRYLDEALHLATQPLILQFGIDPVASRIRVTHLDFRGIRMQGFLVDGAVIFDWDPSVSMLFFNPLVAYNWLTSRLALKPGGGVGLQFIVLGSDLRFDRRGSDIWGSPSFMEFDLQLHRELPVDAGQPQSRP